MHSNSKVALKVLKKHISGLSRHEPEMLFDIMEILNNRYNRFNRYLDFFQDLKMTGVINEMKVAAIKPADNEIRRMYVFNDYNRILCAVYNLSSDDAWTIDNYLRISQNAAPKKFRHKPESISTIYIFSGSELDYSQDMYPIELTAIIRRFESQNLFQNKLL